MAEEVKGNSVTLALIAENVVPEVGNPIRSSVSLYELCVFATERM